MTVILGVCDRQGVWIASDTQVNQQEEICRVRFNKLSTHHLHGKKLVSGWAGDAYIIQLWDYWWRIVGPQDIIRAWTDEDKLFSTLFQFKTWLREEDQLDRQEGETAIFRGGSHLLIAYNDRLWTIGSDGEVLESSCGYDAVGSGKYYAVGIMEYLWEGDLERFCVNSSSEKVTLLSDIITAVSKWDLGISGDIVVEYVSVEAS